MEKIEFQTLRKAIKGTDKIKIIDICNNCSIIYEGALNNAPAKNWEVLCIHIQENILILEVC